MTLTCPRCHAALRGEKHDTGLAWRCRSCGGQSLNFSQFRRLVPENKANVIWETAMLHPRAPSRRSRCPECARDMAAVLIPVPDRELELEVCRHCQRLWLDCQDNIAGHLSDNAIPGPQPPPLTISPAARERLAEHLARGVRRRSWTSSEPTARIALVAGFLYILFRIILLWLNKRR